MLGVPDGYEGTYATAVSDDGRIVVGAAHRGLNTATETTYDADAAVWIEGEGWRVFAGTTEAVSMSPDGSLVGGFGFPGTAQEDAGWILNAETDDPPRLTGTILAEYGIAGFNPVPRSLAVTEKGTHCLCGDNLVVLPAKKEIRIAAPAADQLFVGGTRDTIRWTSAKVDSVDLYLSADRTLGALTSIELRLPAARGFYVWSVPDSLSRFASILIEDSDDPTVTDTSAFFRIKGYRLTRTGADGDYEAFTPDRHGWSFPNTFGVLDPPTYANTDPFQYLRSPVAGLDPFATAPYRRWEFRPLGETPTSFPDYPATVRAFGTEPFYWIDPFLQIYKDSGLEFWSITVAKPAWNGSCSGMSISAIMAFVAKEAFGAQFPAIGAVDRLNSVVPSLPVPDPVRDVINQLFVFWNGQAALIHGNAHALDTPRQTLAQLKQMLLDPDQTYSTPGYVYINNLPPSPLPSRAHAVVPIRLRRADSAGRWNLDIYDPNAANVTRTIRIDSAANAWSYQPNYDGAGRFLLMDPHWNYYGTATYPSGASKMDWETGERVSETIVIHPPAFARIHVQGADGAVGYADSLVFNTLPEVSFDLVPTGYPSSPASYALPDGRYEVTLSGYPDPVATFAVRRNGISYSLMRADAAPGDTDVYVIGDGVTVRNPDAREKVVTYRSLAAMPAQERSFLVTLPVALGSDSVGFRHEPGDVLVIENGPRAKTYALQIRRNGPDTVVTVQFPPVELGDGHRHRIAPDWDALGDGLAIERDADGDGVWEDAVTVSGTIVANEERKSGRGLPSTEFRLGPTYPNPVRTTTTVAYDLPEPAEIRLTVHDLLGRTVRVLASGPKPAGAYQIAFDADGLTAGTYLVRLEAGRQVQTRTLIVVR